MQLNSDHKRFLVDGKHFFSIDEKTKSVSGYAYRDPASIPPVRTHPMSQKEATTLAQCFVAKLGVALEMKKARTTYRKGIEPQRGEWTIVVNDYHAGIRSISGTILRIDAFSDRILYFRVYPLQVPDSLEQKITAAEAVAEALEFAGKRGYGNLKSGRQPELVIVRPDNLLTAVPGERPMISSKTRLCWSVLLKFTQNSGEPEDTGRVPPLLYVDCQTGDVISGSL
jgi:hypothetical protein